MREMCTDSLSANVIGDAPVILVIIGCQSCQKNVDLENENFRDLDEK